MSQVGQYIRLTADDLDRAIGGPEAIFETLDELFDDDDPRIFDIDKSWNGLAVALENAGVSPAAIYGDSDIPGAEEWGYAVPRSLNPERVRVLSGQLSALDVERVVGDLCFPELSTQGVYPVEIWNHVDPKWLEAHLQALITFFAVASEDRMGMILWRG